MTETVGAAEFPTVTEVVGEVAVLPALSVAIVFRVWVPLEAVVVFHTEAYGALVSVLAGLLSSRNCTCDTELSSVAAAATVSALPETVAAGPGEVIATAGAIGWAVGSV